MRENKNKIILDLFGGTGSWSKPYADAGYTVHNITLPDYDVTETLLPALPGEGLKIVFRGGNAATLEIDPANVYGILAAPPCTEFSMAKTCRPGVVPDFRAGLLNVGTTLNIIWACAQQWPRTLAFWAVENPFARLRFFLGNPPLVFNPWEYGDGWSKKTCIWGYFNNPEKTHKQPPLNWNRGELNEHLMPPLPPGYKCPPGWSKRAARRSMTPPGFANAFFRANQ